MPIVLDYAPDGAIVGGYFYGHAPNELIESGMWRVVLPGAIYARQVHIGDQTAPVHGFLGLMPNGQMGVVGMGQQQMTQGGQEPGFLGAIGNGQVGVGREQVPQGGQESGFLGAMGDGQQGALGNGQMGDRGDGQMGIGPPQVAPGGGELGADFSNLTLPPIKPGNRTRRGNGTRSESGSRSPSPEAVRPFKRTRISTGRSLEVTLPIAVHINKTTGIATIANTAARAKQITRRAAEVPHVGKHFTTKRSVLFRDDKPYICDLCGKDFAHPQDVRAHFNGSSDTPGKGCWKKHRSRPGVTWNGHASCKVSEGGLNLQRCKDGWVFLDQASWDKINAAIEEGRKFKAGVAAGAELATGTELNGTKNVNDAGSEMGSSPGKSVTPKRKVVRAGDETETDLGARTK